MLPSAKLLTMVVGVCFCILGLTRFWQKNSVRTDIAKSESNSGFGLFQVNQNRIYEVDVATRKLDEKVRFIDNGTANYGALSPDGTEVAFIYCSPPGLTHPTPNSTVCPAGHLHLGEVRLNDRRFQAQSNLRYPYGMCWSHNRSQLALKVSESTGEASVGILNLNSNQFQKVGGMYDLTTSQCWSPDDGRFVYTEDNGSGISNVSVFDTKLDKRQIITKGDSATWSPDGNWIAFIDGGSYYAVHPDGTGRKPLFRTGLGASPLWWSPDSQYVAYVSGKRLSERSPNELFVEAYRLRVRRLPDGEEDWLLNLGDMDDPWFQWSARKF